MDEIELELCRAKQEWISFDVNNCTLQGFQAKWLTDKGFSRRPEPLVRGMEIDVDELAKTTYEYHRLTLTLRPPWDALKVNELMRKDYLDLANYLKANAHVWLKEVGGE